MRLQRERGSVRLVTGAVVASVGLGSVSAAALVPTASEFAPAVLAVSQPAASTGGARAVFARMSEAQRIGQLFMVGGAATGVGAATLSAISSYHVGNVILTGRSRLGVGATASITKGLQARASSAATLGVPLLISSDQEGGYVQVLSGSGFSAIPQALAQGGWSAATLQAAAEHWGGQLKAAGVNVDLAPVLDTVPAGAVNPPIGYYNREYGHSTAVVGPHGTAFAVGLARAGVAAAVKHFPGLGRVSANTDTTAGVTDGVTTYDDGYLAPFRSAVAGGAPLAMVSSAYYRRIDASHPAVFSSTIIGGMLRGELGFKGVVISDDLGSARQVAAWSPGQRAVDFLQAGGDMVLTVDPAVLPAMVQAVSAAVASSPAMRAKVDAAALLVLQAKQAQGLIRPGAADDFDGDGRTDVAVWRPSTGTWLVRGIETVQWGYPGDVPVPADYNGDGRTDLAVWRPSTGTWWVRGIETVQWGRPGDVPVTGDFNGDGRTDLGVFRPSTRTWWIRGVETVQWGYPGDMPVTGDFNGDGRTDVAVFRPSTRTWLVRGIETVQWGYPGDVPVPADYNGDGRTDLAVWRPSTGTWLVRGVQSVQWGRGGDTPVLGDFNSDGALDLASWRPSTGTWWIRGVQTVQWGLPDDVPV